jgi:hypothetical protein
MTSADGQYTGSKKKNFSLKMVGKVATRLAIRNHFEKGNEAIL